MTITIIGSGNVATCLGRLFKNKGHQIIQVLARNVAAADELASILETQAAYHFSQINRDADLYIVALTDNALPELHRQLQLSHGLVVHTAGAVPLDVLQQVAPDYGVLYPLQSLRKQVDSYPHIPLLVDANTPNNTVILGDFAKTITDKVGFANDDERLKLHLAAVFVANFTNHLYALASDYCTREQVDFSLLFPLIQHTGDRLHHFNPATVQTGPAIRKDTQTMQKHLSTLANYPLLQHIYTQLSNSIQQYHHSVESH